MAWQIGDSMLQAHQAGSEACTVACRSSVHSTSALLLRYKGIEWWHDGAADSKPVARGTVLASLGLFSAAHLIIYMKMPTRTHWHTHNVLLTLLYNSAGIHRL